MLRYWPISMRCISIMLIFNYGIMIFSKPEGCILLAFLPTIFSRPFSRFCLFFCSYKSNLNIKWGSKILVNLQVDCIWVSLTVFLSCPVCYCWAMTSGISWTFSILRYIFGAFWCSALVWLQVIWIGSLVSNQDWNSFK